MTAPIPTPGADDLDMLADAAWRREFNQDRFHHYLTVMARQLGILHAAPFALETRIDSVAALWRANRGKFAGKDAQGQWDVAMQMLRDWAKQIGLEVAK